MLSIHEMFYQEVDSVEQLRPQVLNSGQISADWQLSFILQD